MHPVLLQVGSFQLRSYATFVALGAVLCFFLLKRQTRAMGLRKEEHYWLLLNFILGFGFLFARLVFILMDVPVGSIALWKALVSVNSGFSIFGFILGTLGGTYLFSRLLGLDPLRVADQVSAALPAWQALARIGCFLNGCCYGRPMLHRLPWEVSFTNPRTAIPAGLLGVPLHPAQLYECLGDVLLGAFLFVIVLRGIQRADLPRGSACATYLAGYASLRFILEILRGETTPCIGRMTVGQLLSLGLFLIALAIFVMGRHKKSFVRSPCRG